MLGQSEQVKQKMKIRQKRQPNWSNQSRLTINEVSTNQPIAKRNTIGRFGKLVELDRETNQSVILMLANVTRADRRTRSEYDAGN